MQNISEILKSADATLDDIIKVVIYVTDMAQSQSLMKFTQLTLVNPSLCVRLYAFKHYRLERQLRLVW